MKIFQKIKPVIIMTSNRAVLIFLFVALINAADEQFQAKQYLLHYGYIEENSQADFETVLISFQERYNLPVDGTLNTETLKLINRHRCSVGENRFRIHHSKWNKTHLFWYFPQGQDTHINGAEKAFKLWEENSNLKFTRLTLPTQKPDITITVVAKSHSFRYNCQGSQKCPFKFDVGELAHAYFPEDEGGCREIHLDIAENWYYGVDGNLENNQISFLMVLTHEIGHTLGLSHSDVESAIMFPWYSQTIKSLDEDDKMALEALYGSKTPSTTSTATLPSEPTPTTRSTPTSTATLPSEPAPTQSKAIKNLCDVLNPEAIFLAYASEFSNYYLYVIHDNLLWKVNINEQIIPKPENLSSYLPMKIENITHVFQHTPKDLMVYAGKRFYSVSFPDLNIRKEIHHIDLGGSHINAVFQTYVGKTFIWYNNASFIEIDNQYRIINRGYVRNIFSGIPGDISGAFRYIDGHLYFFREKTYYKFNEFKRKVTEVGIFNWKIFNLSCPDNTLLDQLKLVLSKIIKLYE